MEQSDYFYPIGEAGKPWSAEQTAAWLKSADVKKRSYQTEVLDKINALKADGWEVEQYGALSQDPERYPLFSIKTTNWDSSKPSVLITGGVHGYEESGVQGALLFCKTKMGFYAEKGFNILCCPCVSPWGYECVQRWASTSQDPNRAFFQNVDDCLCEEAAGVMRQVIKCNVEQWTMHIDMHETTDSDQDEFRPAKAARDGGKPETSAIPDGFYLVSNSSKAEDAWHEAMINAVRQITHIAPTDANGMIIGDKARQDGVIAIPADQYHLCMTATNAKFATTTEVYPDSKATPVTAEQCNNAQVACASSGLDWIIANTL